MSIMMVCGKKVNCPNESEKEEHEMKKKLFIMVAVGVIMTIAGFPVYAGQWKLDSIGYWYEEDKGTYPTDSWRYIGEKWYYFDGQGYMVKDTWVGDYYVGSDGAMLPDKPAWSGYATEEEVYMELQKYYANDPSEVTVMEGEAQEGYYYCDVRCGVPGNSYASQRLYEVEVDMKTGEVKELNLITEIQNLFNLREMNARNSQ